MKVVSVNIGTKQPMQWRGKTVMTGIFKYPVEQSIFLGKSDVKGDEVIDRKYHGGEFKACYIYSADHYSFWKEKYPQLKFEYGMFGENITVEGMQEDDICLGDVYQLGAAKVEVTQPREPCFKLGARFDTQKILKQFINAPYPGSYLKVIEEGEVAAGDQLKLVSRKYEQANLQRVYHLMYHSDSSDISEIKQLLEIPNLPKGLVKALKKRLGLKRFL